MDKRIILAVAGSGKTSYLIEQLDTERKSLILTYTVNNIEHIRSSIVKKFGYFPANITLDSYFSFLYSFCFKPLLSDITGSKGIFYERPPDATRMLQRDNMHFYMSANGYLYSSRLAKLLETKGVIPAVNERIAKYYDNLFIDEVQDFGGNDFEFLKALLTCSIRILLVGDFFQHTFDTSTDGRLNSSLYDDYTKYQKHFRKAGITIDVTTLQKSYRCSPTICDFIREQLNVPIYSNRTDTVSIRLLDSAEDADAIFRDGSIVKLFYDDHSKFDCYSQNWGASKGLDHFQDVCVVLNKTSFKKFQNEDLATLSPKTLNKFYVACSRAKGNLYFLADSYLKQYKQ